MENGSNPGSTQGRRPKLGQPVNWKLNTAHVALDMGQRDEDRNGYGDVPTAGLESRPWHRRVATADMASP